MNSKQWAVCFCVLFASSFVHAWVDGRESLKANALRTQSPLLQLLGGVKDHLGSFKNLEKPVRHTGKLYDATSNPIQYYGPSNNENAFAICDTNQGALIIFDVSSQLALLSNGNGAAVMLKLDVDLTVVAAKHVKIGAYNKSNTTVKSFVDNCVLSTLWGLDTTVDIDQSAPETAVLNICFDVFGDLSTLINQTISANLNLALSVAISICVELYVGFSVNLAGIINLTSGELVTLNGDLSACVEIVGGLGDLIEKAGIDLSVLTAASIKIALQDVIGADDGIQAFAKVCLVLGDSFDLSDLLSVIINDISICLSICERLGGGVSVGLNGVVCVLASVVGFLYGSIELEACLKKITKVCVNSDTELDISASLEAFISLINSQISKYESSTSNWSYMLSFWVRLQSGTCTYQDVSLSAIVDLCCAGAADSDFLSLVVDIIVELTAYVTTSLTVELYFATFLKVVLNLFNDISGRIALNLLIPACNVTVNLLNPCLNLTTGLVSATIETIINILTPLLGLLVALAYVPILNICISALSLSISAKAGVSLTSCINASESADIKTDITTWAKTMDAVGC